MVLAMAVLLFQFPAVTMPANAPHGALRQAAAVSAPVSSTQPSARTLPAAPANTLDASATPPQHRTPDAAASEASNPSKASNRTAQPVQPPVETLAAPTSPLTDPLTDPLFSDSILLPPPAFRPPNELPVSHHRLWFALTTVEHSAAGYDAWSTRHALSHGRVEADPLMRPFAGSAAIYPAIQLIPFGLDFLGHRLQRSSGWTHHVWWLPQSLATVTFLFSGSYNVAHTN
jgi:hypothetical protein